jgi:predicted TPR repeat methyltransferase
VAAAGCLPGEQQAPPDYVRTLFDGYADRFEEHLISLGYRVPGLIRTALLSHPKLAGSEHIGPVLDLGCGTGLMAVVLGDLSLGPFTGVDLSPQMLAGARAKQLYAELREGEVLAELRRDAARWPVIIAGDVLCYFGALEQVLAAVHARLFPGGWFVFSVEELASGQDDAGWALHRQGRYAHSFAYVRRAVQDAGFTIRSLEQTTLRLEAGAPVAGMIVAAERMRHDG